MPGDQGLLPLLTKVFVPQRCLLRGQSPVVSNWARSGVDADVEEADDAGAVGVLTIGGPQRHC